MTDPRFVHLRMHTEYSVTDSIIRIDDAIDEVRRQGGVAFGVTDMMNVFGGLRFYTHAQKAGLKPILGCDIKIKNTALPDSPDVMTLYCMNREGFTALSELLTRAFLETDPRFRGQIDEEWFAEPGATRGLIALTGGVSGKISRLLQSDLERVAEETIARYAEWFPDRLYLEVQRSGKPIEEFNIHFLANHAVKTGLPLVATHPVQFLHKEDFEAHEVRCCIAEGYTLSDPRRKKNVTPEQYLKTEEEMCELFADLPGALVNSVEIAKRCNIDGLLSAPQLPDFPTPEGMSLDDYMDHLSREGLERRLEFLYHDEKERDERRPEYVKRLDYELGIIKKMQFPGYFLIVQDFINWSKKNGVPVGPGRGSGAGSLVAYSLGITDLDPLKYDLLFERFLNPERVSMPDFDVDFCQYNRDRTIEYVKRTYGVDAVSQIATFGTLGAKAVIRDVSRVMGLPFRKADELSKLVPAQPGKNVTLKECMESVPGFKEFVEADVQYKEVLRMARPLEGLTRNLGMHAGGVLIAPRKLTDFCPLYNSDGAPENTVSQFDKKDVENAGLVKFDFLGLTTLSILQKCKEYIDQLNPGTDFDLSRIPIDDAETYRTFQEGRTVAVFQFESSGMQQLLMQAKPDRLEDLIALNALYRPGPMDLIPSFINRKFGREEITYLDPRMEPVLKETYGIMVYQEQVMRVAQVVGGYSLGGADLLRRAMGKKNVEEMQRQRAVFIKGAGERGVSASVATEIFNLMEKFAGYGFNKSHAAAYSYVAYQTAYLKTHHTAPFMAANLCMVMDQSDKIRHLIDDAAKYGVAILPPDVNKSEWFFTTPDTKHIRYGFGGIKGMGRMQADSIVEARKKDGPFIDLFDLAARVPSLSGRLLEGLIRAGALDSLDRDRGKLHGNIAQAVSAAQTVASSAGQSSLFGDIDEPQRIVNWIPARSWSKYRELKLEKHVLGLAMSGGMYDVYRDELKSFGGTPIERILKSPTRPSSDKRRHRSKKGDTRVAGVITEVREISGKRGLMGILTIEDDTGSIDVTCFNDIYERARIHLKVDNAVCIEGFAEYDNFRGGMAVRATRIITMTDHRAAHAQYVRIRVKDNIHRDSIDKIHTIVLDHLVGYGVPVVLQVEGKELTGRVVARQQVGYIDDLIDALNDFPDVVEAELVY